LKGEKLPYFATFLLFLGPKKSFPHRKTRKYRKMSFLLWSENSFANPNSVVRDKKSKNPKIAVLKVRIRWDPDFFSRSQFGH
jgi:hypothetical protein